MKSGVHAVVMSQPQGADDDRKANMTEVRMYMVSAGLSHCSLLCEYIQPGFPPRDANPKAYRVRHTTQ